MVRVPSLKGPPDKLSYIEVGMLVVAFQRYSLAKWQPNILLVIRAKQKKSFNSEEATIRGALVSMTATTAPAEIIQQRQQ